MYVLFRNFCFKIWSLLRGNCSFLHIAHTCTAWWVKLGTINILSWYVFNFVLKGRMHGLYHFHQTKVMHFVFYFIKRTSSCCMQELYIGKCIYIEIYIDKNRTFINNYLLRHVYVKKYLALKWCIAKLIINTVPLHIQRLILIDQMMPISNRCFPQC